MGQPKRLTEDQQAVARKAYRLATTEVVRFVRRNHPLVWEHALKEAFVLLGAQPPTIVGKGRDDQKVKKYANDLPVAYLRQKEINRLASMPLRAGGFFLQCPK
jgi:hypothetical protein